MSISSVGSNVIGRITKFKPLQKCCNYFDKNPAQALAYGTIFSVIAKDGVGCYMYVNQSLHNKKIPEEKRKFVAAYDLTNGILMMATQVLCFFGMRKLNKTLFPKIFSKSFDKAGNVLKTISTKIRKEQKDAGLTSSRKLQIKREYEKLKQGCFDIFSFFTELAAATIFAKRIVVPMISTPLANKVKNKMGNEQPQGKQETKTQTTVEADKKPEEQGRYNTFFYGNETLTNFTKNRK